VRAYRGLVAHLEALIEHEEAEQHR
jgi:hypothetical protein